MDARNTGALIAARRKALGLTQKQLAERLLNIRQGSEQMGGRRELPRGDAAARARGDPRHHG